MNSNNHKGIAGAVIIFAVAILFIAASFYYMKDNLIKRNYSSSSEEYLDNNKDPDQMSELIRLVNANSNLSRFIMKVKEKNPSFNLNKFNPGTVTKITPLSSEKVDVKNTSPAWVFSADGKKAVNWEAGFESPDSSLFIFNRKDDGFSEVVLECGIPCKYWGALWVDNNRFVFLMDRENSNGEEGFDFLISLYDLKNGSVQSYTQNFPERPSVPIWPEWEKRLSNIKKGVEGQQ